MWRGGHAHYVLTSQPASEYIRSLAALSAPEPQFSRERAFAVYLTHSLSSGRLRVPGTLQG